MAYTYVTVPSCFEANFTLGDGSTGFSLSQALSLKEKVVPNLYSVGVNKFEFDFQERGVGYNETVASVLRAQASFEVRGCSQGLSLTVDPTPEVKWGVNFAGKVLVKHSDGCERFVYLPGTRTYDPAGMTGKLLVISIHHELFALLTVPVHTLLCCGYDYKQFNLLYT